MTGFSEEVILFFSQSKEGRNICLDFFLILIQGLLILIRIKPRLSGKKKGNDEVVKESVSLDLKWGEI